MTFDTIYDYAGFCAALRRAGFSMAGENGGGIFSLAAYFGENMHWHTGDPQTDPWAFRMRVLTEENGIGYGKLFFSKGGYLTKEWAPWFLCAKRAGQTFEDRYRSGRMGLMERDICRFVAEKGEAAFHEIKGHVGARGLEAALARLQTEMFLTISGQTVRLSRENVPYGWPVTTFRLAEDFWGPEVAARAAAISPREARERIAAQVRLLNPQVPEKTLKRFLA